MDKSIQITLIIAATVLLVALLGYTAFTQLIPATNTINANGVSEIKAMPDLVTVYFNVQTNGSTSQDANDKNAKIVDDVITSIIKLGFERKDITTQNFNIYPDYEWTDNGRQQKGYVATHELKVELSVDEINKAGSVIDAGADAGALISYVNFELSQTKQNEYKAQALTAATQDARIKAEAIAKGLGKNVGDIVSVSTSDWGYRPWMLYESAMPTAAGAKEAVTSIQPGEQSVTASVTVVYKLA